MKKKIIALIAVVAVMILLGVYWLLNVMFPKAEPIRQLEVGMLESVSLYDNENQEIVLSEEDLQKLVNYINSAKPTRIMSVNDYPSVRPYYVVEVDMTERQLRYKIYEDNATAYVEISYEGIYEIDREAVELLE